MISGLANLKFCQHDVIRKSQYIHTYIHKYLDNHFSSRNLYIRAYMNTLGSKKAAMDYILYSTKYKNKKSKYTLATRAITTNKSKMIT